ncbi:D-2-hydroxyacid dehydrogenase [Alkalicoccus chagannorensis]|uniref:D-2-hydroxyacid dehydrogenase n=1 Tax=Alkalicoccus chagannorensis TaxID=427072 RepID=UPI00042A053C|nr:D-2-hydroxyacid dehydrogenase [Alkalicoccus chagannorensis]
MTIIVAQNIDDSWKKTLQEAAPDHRIITGRDQEHWEKEIHEAEVIAGWKPQMEALLPEDAPLQWIQTWSAGVDHLPLDRYEAKGWMVTSANGVHAYPISETIFMFLLGWTRKLGSYVRQQQLQQWHHAGLNDELHGKTMMLFGLGAVGEETARIGDAFRMNVIGVRRSGKSSPYASEVLTLQEAAERIAEADVVVNTLPLTNETMDWFDKNTFERMKADAFFVNIGRGSTVVEKDLIEALEAGTIAGAGLDVFEQEPLPEDHPFWQMEQVMMTPHTAGSTRYYHDRVLEQIFLPNLKSWLENKEPGINRVSFDAGY